MKETELKPCPFCGYEARLYFDVHDMNGVVCKKCGAKIYGFGSRGSAKSAWNRRADNEQRED
jgi:Lar family restriction alleviation protein